MNQSDKKTETDALNQDHLSNVSKSDKIPYSIPDTPGKETGKRLENLVDFSAPTKRIVEGIIERQTGKGESIKSQTEVEKPILWNYALDKGKLKHFVSWFLKTYGEKKTLELLEELKILGFGYATQAGISLGIEDLKIPPQKAMMLAKAKSLVDRSRFLYKRGTRTDLEKTQSFMQLWNEVNEDLKDEVVAYFQKTNVLNPVYMMAFSGARGNLSQVRQLVGMRGLMSDPQGKIIDFPILSNFREGLTLTEYLISTYGARKGIVDTALRTATAGYLTRRLVDVAQHVVVSKLDCGTQRGIFLFDMKEGSKTIYAFQNRLIGRVLAQDIYIIPEPYPSTGFVSNSNIPIEYRREQLSKQGIDTGNRRTITADESMVSKIFVRQTKIASKNTEVDERLAQKIAKITKRALVRSPLTCEQIKRVCQLCYGWSLATSRLVSIGEAVGVIAGQSIGEPGTQLTMRTFHTGGVFAGNITEQINAPFDTEVEYSHPMAGSLLRVCLAKNNSILAFLTKSGGTMILKERSRSIKDYESIPLGAGSDTGSKHSADAIQRGDMDEVNEDQNLSKFRPQEKIYKLPPFTLLFARHGEFMPHESVLAQISGINIQKPLPHLATDNGSTRTRVSHGDTHDALRALRANQAQQTIIQERYKGYEGEAEEKDQKTSTVSQGMDQVGFVSRDQNKKETQNSISKDSESENQKDTQTGEQTVYTSLEGEIYYSDLNLTEEIDPKYGERVSKSQGWAKVWVLAAKIFQTPLSLRPLYNPEAIAAHASIPMGYSRGAQKDYHNRTDVLERGKKTWKSTTLEKVWLEKQERSCESLVHVNDLISKRTPVQEIKWISPFGSFVLSSRQQNQKYKSSLKKVFQSRHLNLSQERYCTSIRNTRLLNNIYIEKARETLKGLIQVGSDFKRNSRDLKKGKTTEPFILSYKIPFVLETKTPKAEISFIKKSQGRMSSLRSPYRLLSEQNSGNSRLNTVGIGAAPGVSFDEGKLFDKSLKVLASRLDVRFKTSKTSFTNLKGILSRESLPNQNKESADLWMKENRLSFPVIHPHYKKIGYGGGVLFSENPRSFDTLDLKKKQDIFFSYFPLKEASFNKRSILKNTNIWQPKSTKSAVWYPSDTELPGGLIWSGALSNVPNGEVLFQRSASKVGRSGKAKCALNNIRSARTFAVSNVGTNVLDIARNKAQVKRPKTKKLRQIWQQKMLNSLNLSQSQICKKNTRKILFLKKRFKIKKFQHISNCLKVQEMLPKKISTKKITSESFKNPCILIKQSLESVSLKRKSKPKTRIRTQKLSWMDPKGVLKSQDKKNNKRIELERPLKGSLSTIPEVYSQKFNLKWRAERIRNANGDDRGDFNFQNRRLKGIQIPKKSKNKNSKKKQGRDVLKTYQIQKGTIVGHSLRIGQSVSISSGSSVRKKSSKIEKNKQKQSLEQEYPQLKITLNQNQKRELPFTEIFYLHEKTYQVHYNSDNSFQRKQNLSPYVQNSKDLRTLTPKKWNKKQYFYSGKKDSTLNGFNCLLTNYQGKKKKFNLGTGSGILTFLPIVSKPFHPIRYNGKSLKKKLKKQKKQILSRSSFVKGFLQGSLLKQSFEMSASNQSLSNVSKSPKPVLTSLRVIWRRNQRKEGEELLSRKEMNRFNKNRNVKANFLCLKPRNQNTKIFPFVENHIDKDKSKNEKLKEQNFVERSYIQELQKVQIQFKPGWLYYTFNSKNVFKKTKRIQELGHNVLDDLHLDRPKILCEPLKRNSFNILKEITFRERMAQVNEKNFFSKQKEKTRARILREYKVQISSNTIKGRSYSQDETYLSNGRPSSTKIFLKNQGWTYHMETHSNGNGKKKQEIKTQEWVCNKKARFFKASKIFDFKTQKNQNDFPYFTQFYTFSKCLSNNNQARIRFSTVSDSKASFLKRSAMEVSNGKESYKKSRPVFYTNPKIRFYPDWRFNQQNDARKSQGYLIRSFDSKYVQNVQARKTYLYEHMIKIENQGAGRSYELYRNYWNENLNAQKHKTVFLGLCAKLDFELTPIPINRIETKTKTKGFPPNIKNTGIKKGVKNSRGRRVPSTNPTPLSRSRGLLSVSVGLEGIEQIRKKSLPSSKTSRTRAIAGARTFQEKTHFHFYGFTQDFNMCPYVLSYNLENPDWKRLSLSYISWKKEPKNGFFGKGKNETQQLLIHDSLYSRLSNGRLSLYKIPISQGSRTGVSYLLNKSSDLRPSPDKILERVEGDSRKQNELSREEHLKIREKTTLTLNMQQKKKSWSWVKEKKLHESDRNSGKFKQILETIKRMNQSKKIEDSFYNIPKFECGIKIHYDFFCSQTNSRFQTVRDWKKELKEPFKIKNFNFQKEKPENFRVQRMLTEKRPATNLLSLTIPKSENFLNLDFNDFIGTEEDGPIGFPIRQSLEKDQKQAIGLTRFYSPFEGLVLKDYSLVHHTSENLKKTFNTHLDDTLLQERRRQQLILTKEDIFSLNFLSEKNETEKKAIANGLKTRVQVKKTRAIRSLQSINQCRELPSAVGRPGRFYDNRNHRVGKESSSVQFKNKLEKQTFFENMSKENPFQKILEKHKRFQIMESEWIKKTQTENYQIFKIQAAYKEKRYTLNQIQFQQGEKPKTFRIGQFSHPGDSLYGDYGVPRAGQVLHLNGAKVTLRKAEYFSLLPRAILHGYNGHTILPNNPVMTLAFETLNSGDIVQGIPKVEQYLEARTTIQGRLFLNSLPVLLYALYKRYLGTLEMDKAVRQSFLKIQQILVDGVQRVYRSQGVGITDKHLEVIVRQMTSKVKIIYGGQTGFFPGELVDLELLERVNKSLVVKVVYEPVVLGITRASLEVDSFLSAASFQQTTKVLTRAALENKRDFLKGLKENLLVGNLLPAGTGYVVPLKLS